MPAIFTAREYNQDASRVKRAAKDGPVIITERGKPAHVMMTMATYRALTVGRGTEPLVEFLEGLALDEIDLTRDRDTGRDAPL